LALRELVMFGHDALNHGNIGRLLLNSDSGCNPTLFTKIEPQRAVSGIKEYDRVKMTYPDGNSQSFQTINGALDWLRKKSISATSSEESQTYCIVGFTSSDGHLNTDGIENGCVCAQPSSPPVTENEEKEEEEEEITTQTDVSSQVEPEEPDNTLLYGAIAVVLIGGAFLFLK